MTGIFFTAATTARMPAKLTVPLKPCARVRPCTKIAATPVSSRTRARSGAVRLFSSQPRRIFAVIGIFTASTIPRTSRAVLASSVIIAEPPPMPVTFLTGHPILISTEAMPSDSTMRAASRISSGTAPKSCTASRCSAGAVRIICRARGLFSISDRALTKSVVVQSSPPISRTTSRKGRLV